MAKIIIPGEYVASRLIGRARIFASLVADCFVGDTARRNEPSAWLTGFASWLMAPPLRASALPRHDVENLLTSIDRYMPIDFPSNTALVCIMRRERLETTYQGFSADEAAAVFLDMISPRWCSNCP
ncbi:MAG: hypothetical protein ABL932_07570 [Terricaulis sp.]